MRVRSDLASPLIAALYLVLLPIWGLLLASELSSPAPRALFVVGYAALALVSVGQVPRGLTIARQRVDADAVGLRLRGIGGFAVAWTHVESLALRPRKVGANVLVVLRPGHAVRSEYLVTRTRRRSIGVEPDQVDALAAVAASQGVQVEAGPATPPAPWS